MASLTDITREGIARHGDKFDASDLAPQFAHFYGGQRLRVRVATTYGTGPNAETYIRTGTIGKTTGWRPAFLLIHRSSDHGSSDVLGPRDVVTHVQLGRTYVPVTVTATHWGTNPR